MSVAPKLPKEIFCLPETTRHCPACGVRPRRPVRFCTHCGTLISRSRRQPGFQAAEFTPSFSLSEPENGSALRTGFVIFSLALPLFGLLFFLKNPQAFESRPAASGESALSRPIGQEISTETPSRASRKPASSAQPLRRGGETNDAPEEAAPNDGEPSLPPPSTIPDTPRPVQPYRTPPVATQSPISVPVKSRPLPTPPLPGPDFKNEKRTEFEPRP